MNLPTQFLLGSFGLSLVITYAWWTRIRVWAFRQDLFAIRDELWDAMRGRAQLENPAHRDLRDGINSLIRLAPFLSLVTVVNILLRRDEFKNLLALRDDAIPELARARLRVLARVVRYLLLESLMGFAFLSLARVFGMADALDKAAEKRIGWLIDSKEFQTLDQHLSRVGQP